MVGVTRDITLNPKPLHVLAVVIWWAVNVSGPGGMGSNNMGSNNVEVSWEGCVAKNITCDE